jgi:predicted nucleic acid-binding protein
VIVVDSSVALQWVLPEAGAQAAEALLGSELAAPDIIFIEVANVLGKKVRAGETTLHHAAGSLELVGDNIGRIEPTRLLIERALELSVDLSHPVDDCAFLSCALALETYVATRDARFVRRAAERGFEDQVRLHPFAAAK